MPQVNPSVYIGQPSTYGGSSYVGGQPVSPTPSTYSNAREPGIVRDTRTGNIVSVNGGTPTPESIIWNGSSYVTASGRPATPAQIQDAIQSQLIPKETPKTITQTPTQPTSVIKPQLTNPFAVPQNNLVNYSRQLTQPIPGIYNTQTGLYTDSSGKQSSMLQKYVPENTMIISSSQQVTTPTTQQVISELTSPERLQTQQVQSALNVVNEPVYSTAQNLIPGQRTNLDNMGGSLASVGGFFSTLGRSPNQANQMIVNTALGMRDKSVGMINKIYVERQNIRDQQARLQNNIVVGLQTNEALSVETMLARSSIQGAVAQLVGESNRVASDSYLASSNLRSELTLLGLAPSLNNIMNRPKGDNLSFDNFGQVDITASPFTGKYVSTTQSTPEGELTTTSFELSPIGQGLVNRFSNLDTLRQQDENITKKLEGIVIDDEALQLSGSRKELFLPIQNLIKQGYSPFAK
jgi:hypothetical protein